MRMLQNFTIRIVMLVILGIFGLLWSGVGLYSVFSLSKVADGNEVDRQLVSQMTLLSQGNDQYFRFVTRLSRAMEAKSYLSRTYGSQGIRTGNRCLAGTA